MNKKVIIWMAGILLLPLWVCAQGVNFRPLSYTEAIELAAKENKMVFIDFYTTWCGPCKRMSKEVFPQQEVGEYFNRTFISLKLDAEKENGLELAKKYAVKAFPTFVVLSPDGTEVFRTSGYRPADEFVEKIRKGIDPRWSPAGLTKRYEKGERILVTSDQDSTFDFLASLFLSFCFIKLVRYADHNCEGGKLPVPVHILGEELTACGTIPDLSRRLSVIRSRNISMSCVFQNLAGLQNRYPQNLWQEIIGNCDAQLFLGCTDQLTAEFISARTGLASVAVSSKSKQLGTWRISNYTPEFRETSGVGKRPVLTPDEVLRLPLDQALIIIRGKKVLQVDKMDYSKHPEAKYLRSCKASAHVPEWRRLEEEAAKTPQPTPKPAPAAKKPAKRKATKPASPTDKSPKEAPAPKSAGTPEGIITTDKDSILS